MDSFNEIFERFVWVGTGALIMVDPIKAAFFLVIGIIASAILSLKQENGE